MVPDPDTACVGLEYFCFRGDDLWTMSDDDLVALATRRARTSSASRRRTRSAAATSCASRSPTRCTTPSTPSASRRSATWLDPIEGLVQVGRNGLHRYNNSDHSMLSAMRAVDNLIAGTDHDIWAVNVESAYHEEESDADAQQPYKKVPTTPALEAELKELPPQDARARRRSSRPLGGPLATGSRGAWEPAGSSIGRLRTKRAPGAVVVDEDEVAAEAAGQLAADREAEAEALLAARRAAALEALEDQVALGGRDARPGVARPPPSRARRGRRRSTRTGAPRGAKRSALSSRIRTIRATAPGSPFAQHGAIGGTTSTLSPRSAARSSNSAATARVSSPSSTRLGAQRRLGVEPGEVEQVGGEVLEAAQLALGARDLRVRVLEVDAALGEVVVEQLEHPLEQGQRRAQLVRRGGDERAPRLLLAAQRRVHRRQRAGEVADLVAGVVDRRRRGEAARLVSDRRLAQPLEPAQRAREASPPPRTSATTRPTSAAVRNAARTWSTVSPTSVCGRVASIDARELRCAGRSSGTVTWTSLSVTVRSVRWSMRTR